MCWPGEGMHLGVCETLWRCRTLQECCWFWRRTRTGGDAHPGARGGGKVRVLAQEAVLRLVHWRKSSRAACRGAWESRAAVSPHWGLNAFVSVTRLTLSLFCANFGSLQCTSSPSPSRASAEVASSPLLPFLRVLGRNTHCCLPHELPARAQPLPQDWDTWHCCDRVALTLGTRTLSIPAQKRAKEASTLCMLRGLSCAQAARPDQDTVVLP